MVGIAGIDGNVLRAPAEFAVGISLSKGKGRPRPVHTLIVAAVDKAFEIHVEPLRVRWGRSDIDHAGICSVGLVTVLGRHTGFRDQLLPPVVPPDIGAVRIRPDDPGDAVRIQVQSGNESARTDGQRAPLGRGGNELCAGQSAQHLLAQIGCRLWPARRKRHGRQNR